MEQRTRTRKGLTMEQRTRTPRFSSLLLLLASFSPTLAQSPSLSVTLTDDPLSAPLPANFLGFSGAEASLSVLSWRPAQDAPFAPRPSYVALMRLLGGSVRHRFGHFYAPRSSTHAFSPGSIEVNATNCARLTDAMAAFNGTLTGMVAPLDLADGNFVAATGAALKACFANRLLSLELASASVRGRTPGATPPFLSLTHSARARAHLQQMSPTSPLSGGICRATWLCLTCGRPRCAPRALTG